VPAELQQRGGGLADLFDMFVTAAPKEPESDLDLLAEAMRMQAMRLASIEALPKVRDLLIRGADAILQLQADLDEAEGARSQELQESEQLNGEAHAEARHWKARSEEAERKLAEAEALLEIVNGERPLHVGPWPEKHGPAPESLAQVCDDTKPTTESYDLLSGVRRSEVGDHFKRVCAEHGSLLAQCRCPNSNKRVERVPCPGSDRCSGAPR
jgi:hypothetical protein